MIKKALVLSTLSLSFVSFAAFAQNVAVVNGKAIPSSYSDEAVKEVVKQGGKDTPELRNNIKTQLIVGEVLLQEAEKQNLASTDAVKNGKTLHPDRYLKKQLCHEESGQRQ